LVLGPYRHLRQPRILSIDGVPQQFELEAIDILLDPESIERGPGDIELLTGVRQFDAVEQARRRPVGIQVQVAELDIGEMRVCAPARARAIATDERQRDQPAAATAFQVTE